MEFERQSEKAKNNKKKKKKMSIITNKSIAVLILFVCIILLYSNIISAADFDNRKEYNPNTRTVIIKDNFGLGGNLAEIKLNTPLNVVVPRGYQKIAEIELKAFEDRDNAFTKVDLYDRKLGRSLDNRNKINSRQIDYRVKTIENVLVDDFKTTCSNSTKLNECTREKTGQHIEQVEAWNLLENTNFKTGQTYTIGIFTDVKPGDNVEWIPTFWGFEIPEWATWTESLNVDLVSYLKMDVASGNPIDSMGNVTFTAVNITQYQYPGKINYTMNFTRVGNSQGSQVYNNSAHNISAYPFSFNLWANVPSQTTENGVIYLTYANSNYNVYGMGFFGTDNIKLVACRNTGGVECERTDSATDVVDGTWHMLTAVFVNATYRQLYVDGVNKINNTISVPFSNANLLVLGAENNGAGFPPGIQYPVNGALDEIGIWKRSLSVAEVQQLYNNGAGLPFQIYSANVTLNSPENAYESINPNVTFNVTVIDNVGIENVTLYIDGIANETNTSGFNGTYIFNKTFSFASHNWSVSAWNSNNFQTNSSTRNFLITQIVASQTFNTTTTETFTESYIANVTLASGISLINATLIWNGTSYTGSIASSGDNRILSRTLTIPSVATTTNITFYWQLTLNNGTNFLYNITAQNVTVLDLSIDNCAVNSILILNYTIKDEDTRITLNETTDNITSNIYATISGDFGGSSFASFNGTSTSNNIQICVNSSLVSNKNYRLDSTIQFTAFDYVTEYYYIKNFSLNTTNIPQNISLYLLSSNRSQEFLITVKDVNLIPISEAIVEITRQYLSLGQFLTVENSQTDNDGQTIGHFVLNDEIYTIYVKLNGEVIAIFENVKAFCDDVATGDCKIFLNQAGSTINPQSFTNYLGISGVETYNDTTKTYAFTFSSADGTSKNINVTIWKFDNYLNQTICSDTLDSSSGTINCVIPSAYYNNSALVRVYVDGELFSQSSFEISISKSSQLNNSRYLWAFFLLISLPFLAMTSGVWMLILFAVGLIFAGLLTLIDIGSIIGPTSAALWIIIAIVILIWKINKDETQF